MRIPIERGGATPIYRQIAEHLRQGILGGSLTPESRLPAVRCLARDLGISRITVETAYAELEADGLIAPRQGSGTYVLPPYQLPIDRRSDAGLTWPLWQQDLSLEQLHLRQVPAELLLGGGHPHPISFADGGGDQGLFPVVEFRKVLQQVMRNDGVSALGYGDQRGLPVLRETIAEVLASQGLLVDPGHVLITSGSQQAISLALLLLLKPGDSILVESPTYGRALDLFRSRGLRIVGVPVDQGGLRVEQLEEQLQQFHPKLIYTIPNFQNPSGACMTGSRRRQLLALAARYNVPILEDDFVGDLRYEGSAQPALKALDPGGRVIYVSTFSKMLLPGLRVGFMVAEGPVYDGLAKQKYLHDLATSNLLQRALQAYVTVGRYQAHLRHSCQVYRQRRDNMRLAIKRHLPAEVTFYSPLGGLFIWLGLPQGMSAERLLPVACAAGVAFEPGGSFYPNQMEGDGYLRLNFATQGARDIDEGIRRLGQAIRGLAESE